MHVLFRQRWQVVALLFLCGCAGQAQAVPRALLVGVSELVNQPATLWLQAPRNDVALMRDTLLGLPAVRPSLPAGRKRLPDRRGSTWCASNWPGRRASSPR